MNINNTTSVTVTPLEIVKALLLAEPGSIHLQRMLTGAEVKLELIQNGKALTLRHTTSAAEPAEMVQRLAIAGPTDAA